MYVIITNLITPCNYKDHINAQTVYHRIYTESFHNDFHVKLNGQIATKDLVFIIRSISGEQLS